jgi:hypothetical protein
VGTCIRVTYAAQEGQEQQNEQLIEHMLPQPEQCSHSYFLVKRLQTMLLADQKAVVTYTRHKADRPFWCMKH